MKNIVTTLIIILLFSFKLLSQPQISLLDRTAIPGDSITVPVTVADFNNIGAITLKIKFNGNVLSWGRILNLNNAIAGAFTGFDNNTIVFAWSNLDGISISSGKLFDLKFLYKGGEDSIYFFKEECETANTNVEVINVVYTNARISQKPVSIDEETKLPEQYNFSPAYPNPFNPTTTINYSIPEKSNVWITIVNSLGIILYQIKNEEQSEGNYNVQWNAHNQPSGVYFIVFEAKSESFQKFYKAVHKVMLIK